MRKTFLLTLFVFLVSGCFFQATHPPIRSQPFQVKSAYQHAVRDASIAEEDEIAHNLITVAPENNHLVWNLERTKLLVVTWKSSESYERYLKPKQNTSPEEANVIWVTTVPQVQLFCQDYVRDNPSVTKEDIDLRLKQYLGLNPAWKYDIFVEMWVRPEDLFRPCVDPEVNDSTCNLKFQDTTPMVKGIQDYPAFYKNLYFSDFRSLPGVPWTGLGYTYDWGNALSEEGASEFILRPDSPYKIHKVIPTVEYCKPCEKK